jgi:predicted DsbA family dithiol-disulfide isomerase
MFLFSSSHTIHTTIIITGYIGKRHLYNAIQEILQTPVSSSANIDTDDDNDTTTTTTSTTATEPQVGRRIDGFAIIRVPYLLEPNYDMSKIYIETNRQRLIQKWGGPQQWEIQKQRHQLKERGLQVGIQHFNLDRYASNTIRSHRIIQYMSRTYGLYISEYVYDRLNQYHFVDGYALNDVPRLAQTIAQSLQTLYISHPSSFTTIIQNNNHTNNTADTEKTLTPPPTEEFILDYLYGTDGQDVILQTVEIVQQEYGIYGIPTFIIDGGNTVLNGAVHAQEFVQIFRTIEQQQHPNTPIFSSVLNIPSHIIERGSYHRK